MQKGMLVTPRDSWPALTGGLTMEYFGEEHEDGQRLLCFEYVQSSSYLVRLQLLACLHRTKQRVCKLRL